MMRTLLLSWLLLVATAAQGAIESYEFDDESLRERYQVLTAELRCPKCQNQTIADSNSPIATDLRAQLYQQLHAGRSDDEILDYMVQRYGEFVLYKPRWSSVTVVLWLAPLILLSLAIWIVVTTFRKKRADVDAVTALSATEQQRLDALLGEEPKA